MCSNNEDSLAALSDALDSVASTAAAAGSSGAGDRLGRLLKARAKLDAVVYAELAAFDAAGGYTDDGDVTAASWLRGQQRVARRDASGLVHHARRLRDLSATAAALAAGTISREHATAIVKAQAAAGLDAAGFGPYETILVELARKASPDEVRTAAAHLIDKEAPDRDKELIEALAGRRFDLVPVGDLVKVDAMIDKSSAELLITSVEALSRRLPGDDRTWHQRRADAFTTIVALGADSGELPRHGRTKPHVSVTLTLDQLTGIDNAGPLLARFGRIPVESARRLACDAVLTRIITDSRGHVLDVGRASRHTTTAQNTALAAMHTTCGYPNCDVPLARCDIHHVTWWSRGGPTDLDNLVPLCKQHHWFVHESGYTITTAHHHPERQASTGPRGWRFLTPNGHPIPDHRTILKHHLQQLSLIQHLPEPILMPQEAPKPVTTPGPVTGPRRHLCPELPAARGPG